MTRQVDQNTDMGKGNTHKIFENPNRRDSFEKNELRWKCGKKERFRETWVLVTKLNYTRVGSIFGL